MLASQNFVFVSTPWMFLSITEFSVHKFHKQTIGSTKTSHSCFRCLLDHGADVAAVNNEGELPLDLAEEEEMEDLLTDEIERLGKLYENASFDVLISLSWSFCHKIFLVVHRKHCTYIYENNNYVFIPKNLVFKKRKRKVQRKHLG